MRTRRDNWVWGLAVVVATVLGPMTPAVNAGDAGDVGGATAASLDAPAPPPIEDERWWGAAGTILCGVEMRLIRVAPAIGMNPYVLAAGLGGCLLAVMDIITSD